MERYLNSLKSDYVFGGPTIPLFKVSYNDISRIATKLDYQNSTNGYQIRQGTGKWINNQMGFGDINTQKGIYFKGILDKETYYTWLASPSAGSDWAMLMVRCDGYINHDGHSGRGHSDTTGFRPIISLKPNVTFTSNEDGSYTIN